MNTPIISSTLLLTLLLVVGLFFFIRASAKDRTQQVTLVAEEPQELILMQLKQYFEQRSYQMNPVHGNTHQMSWQGFVRPSLFLAVFLTFLAVCGWLCLALVLAFLYPSLSYLFFGLVVLAPLAGIYYWRKAGRIEEVSLQIDSPNSSNSNNYSILKITAHRDELIQLQQQLPLKSLDAAGVTVS